MNYILRLVVKSTKQSPHLTKPQQLITIFLIGWEATFYLTLPMVMGGGPQWITNDQRKGASRRSCYLSKMVEILLRSWTLDIDT